MYALPAVDDPRACPLGLLFNFDGIETAVGTELYRFGSVCDCLVGGRASLFAKRSLRGQLTGSTHCT